MLCLFYVLSSLCVWVVCSGGPLFLFSLHLPLFPSLPLLRCTRNSGHRTNWCKGDAARGEMTRDKPEESKSNCPLTDALYLTSLVTLCLLYFLFSLCFIFILPSHSLTKVHFFLSFLLPLPSLLSLLSLSLLLSPPPPFPFLFFSLPLGYASTDP